MDFIIDAIVEWLKGLLVDGIMGNLEGLFTNVNTSVGEIDLFPWLFVWFLGCPKWRPDSSAWALCGAAMLFNLYGALYMLNT